MNNQVLLTYASKYGATAEIAEKIAEVLGQAGLSAAVMPVKEVRDPAAYEAVVLGSAVYMGRWLKRATKFLKSNEKALSKRPVWIFSSGPTGEGDPAELLDGWRYPGYLQPQLDHIRPRDIALFHGDLDPEKVNFIERSLIKNVESPVGDFRDWDAITAWAASIAGSLAEKEASAEQ